MEHEKGLHSRVTLEIAGGQYWTRTSDPRRVKAVLYQLSQLPGSNFLSDEVGVVNKRMAKTISMRFQFLRGLACHLDFDLGSGDLRI